MDALCCSSCGEVIVKSMGDTMKVRSKVITVRDNKALAICKGCNTEIPVPLAFDGSLMKSIAATKKLRLYVNK